MLARPTTTGDLARIPCSGSVTFPIASGLRQCSASSKSLLRRSCCACAPPPSAGLFYLALRGLGFPLLVCSMFTGVLMATAVHLVFVHQDILVFGIDRHRHAADADELEATGSFGLGPRRHGDAVDAHQQLGFRDRIGILPARTGRNLLSMCRLRPGRFAGAGAEFLFPTSSIFFHPILIVSEFDNEMQFNMEADGFQRWTPRDNLVSALVTGAVARPPQVEKGMGRWGPAWVNNTYTPLSEVSLRSNGLLGVPGCCRLVGCVKGVSAPAGDGSFALFHCRPGRLVRTARYRSFTRRTCCRS